MEPLGFAVRAPTATGAKYSCSRQNRGQGAAKTPDAVAISELTDA